MTGALVAEARAVWHQRKTAAWKVTATSRICGTIWPSRVCNGINIETRGRSGLLYSIIGSRARVNLASPIARIATDVPWRCSARHVTYGNGKPLKPALQEEIHKEIQIALHPQASMDGKGETA